MILLLLVKKDELVTAPLNQSVIGIKWNATIILYKSTFQNIQKGYRLHECLHVFVCCWMHDAICYDTGKLK